MLASLYNTFSSKPASDPPPMGYPRLDIFLQFLLYHRPICINFAQTNQYAALANLRKTALSESSTTAEGGLYLTEIETAVRTMCMRRGAEAAAILYGFSRDSLVVTFKDGDNRSFIARGLANELTVAVWNLGILCFIDAYKQRGAGRMDSQSLSCAIDLFEWHSRLAPKAGFGDAVELAQGAFFMNSKHGRVMMKLCLSMWHYEKMLTAHDADPMHIDLDVDAYWAAIYAAEALELSYPHADGLLDVIQEVVPHMWRWWLVARLSAKCDSSKVEVSQAATFHMARIIAEAEALHWSDVPLMKKTLAKSRQFAGIDSWIALPFMRTPEMPDCEYTEVPKPRTDRMRVYGQIKK